MNFNVDQGISRRHVVLRNISVLWLFMTSASIAESGLYGPLGRANRIQTVGGWLEVKEGGDFGRDLLLNGKSIPDAGNAYVWLDYKASINGNDVVVVGSDVGAASNCFASYSFLTVTPQGKATVSEEGADACDAKIESTATEIKITSIEHDGRRTKTTVTTYSKDGIKQSR